MCDAKHFFPVFPVLLILNAHDLLAFHSGTIVQASIGLKVWSTQMILHLTAPYKLITVCLAFSTSLLLIRRRPETYVRYGRYCTKTSLEYILYFVRSPYNKYAVQYLLRIHKCNLPGMDPPIPVPNPQHCCIMCYLFQSSSAVKWRKLRSDTV